MPLIVLGCNKAFPRLWRLFTRRWRAPGGSTHHQRRLDGHPGGEGVRQGEAGDRALLPAQRDRLQRLAADRLLHVDALSHGRALDARRRIHRLELWRMAGLGGQPHLWHADDVHLLPGDVVRPLEFMTHIVDWWTAGHELGPTDLRDPGRGARGG